MSLGYDREQNVFCQGDTAEIVAVLYDREDRPMTEDDVEEVEFTIQKPDGEKVTEPGEIADDGSGTLAFDDTDLVGEYLVIASFSLEAGKRSTRVDFEVIDPFKSIAPSPSWVVADAAWKKIEDCFDGEQDGPWLRDMTLTYFNRDKMENFISEALFDVNQQNPPTNLAVGDFAMSQGTGDDMVTVVTADLPLIAQGVFIAVLRHLMRSYVEQPNPVGAQIAWHDRRDYLQRWQSVYQVEYQQYMRMVALYKRRFLHLGEAKVLVSSKAGRLIPAPMRTRFVGRGYW